MKAQPDGVGCEVVITRSGAPAMRDRAVGELMHPVVGPLVEAALRSSSIADLSVKETSFTLVARQFPRALALIERLVVTSELSQ